MDQWNRKEDPEIRPHSYSMIINKGTKNTCGRKDSLLNKWWQEKLDIHTKNTETRSLPLTMQKSIQNKPKKRTKDLNVRPETLKLV
jgi:hypothetical protein